MDFLNFLISNFESVTSLLSVIALLIGAVFAFVKWIDERKQRLQNDRYEKYIELVKLISGSSQKGSVLEQCAGVWLLLEDKEYHVITLKIFNDEMIEHIEGSANELLKDQLRKAIEEMKGSV